jgi:hypothetical protein
MPANMKIFLSQNFKVQTFKNLIVHYLIIIIKINSIKMNAIVSEKFNSSNDLLAAIKTWSLTYYQPIIIRSSNLLSNEKFPNGAQNTVKKTASSLNISLNTNLVALVNDEDPTLKNYIQDQMREHFNTCNEKNQVTPFPQSTTQLKPIKPGIHSLSLK